jgi:glutathione S-transferase
LDAANHAAPKKGKRLMDSLASPIVILSAGVTLLAALLYFYMSIAVGRYRSRHSVPAPAMTGHPEVERAIRVHYNTLEQLPIFLSALWVSTLWFHPSSIPGLAWASPALGIVWIIGRVLYMQGYMQAADKRGLGFVITALAQILLIIFGFFGIITAWMAVNAV